MTGIIKRKNEHYTPVDIVFYILIYTFFILFTLMCIYPFYYLIINTISANDISSRGNIILLPQGIHFSNYAQILRLSGLPQAMFISVAKVGPTGTLSVPWKLRRNSENPLRAATKIEPLKAEAVGQRCQIDLGDLAHVGRATECRGELGGDGCRRRIEGQCLDLGPIDGEKRLHHLFDPQDVRPSQLESMHAPARHRSASKVSAEVEPHHLLQVRRSTAERRRRSRIQAGTARSHLLS